MKTIIISVIIALSIMGYGFISYEPQNEIKIPETLFTFDNTPVTGQDLFMTNCAICHKADLSGIPPTFPSLKNISEKMTKEEIATLLKTGQNAMPSFAALTDEERKAITGFLYGEKTLSKITTPPTPEQKGAYLFTANCTACHKAKQDEPEPAGRKKMGRTPIVLGGINSIHTFSDFEHILNTGPCYMPSFENLQSEDKEAIYLWLSTIKNPENLTRTSNGCRMRGNCRNR